MQRYDVIIVGAGMAGSAAAWRLAATHRVLVLEQFDFLHAFGSSHGSSRIFRHAYDEPRYVDLAIAAGEGWRELERDAGESLLVHTGGLDLATRRTSALHAIAAALDDVGQAYDMLDARDLSQRFPAFRLPAGGRALFQADAGILPASRCVGAMLRAAAARGAELHAREPVERIRETGDCVEVVTGRGRYHAGQVVVCAGSWLKRFARGLSLPLIIEQQQVIYLRADAPALFADRDAPIFIEHDEDVYGFPIYEHPTAIKVARHTGGRVLERPEERTTSLDEELAREATRVATRILTGVTAEIVSHETCLYTRTPDEHFVIDRHPRQPRILLVGGFSGHGFKFAPAIGRILSDLVRNGPTRHDPQEFSVDRFMTWAQHRLKQKRSNLRSIVLIFRPGSAYTCSTLTCGRKRGEDGSDRPDTLFVLLTPERSSKEDSMPIPEQRVDSTRWTLLRRLAALAALLLVGGALAQTLTIATHYNEEQIAPVAQCAMQYEQEHDVDIVFQQISYADYLQTVLTSRIGGQAPDVYHVYSIWAAQMVENDVLDAPPEDLVQWIRDTYVDSTVDAVTIDDQVWGIPTEVSNYLLVYNKQLLQDAGFDGPPSTWDELADMAGQITETNAQGQITTAGYAFGPSVANVVHPFFALLYSRGVSPFTEDFTGTNLASEEAIAVLEDQIGLFREGITNSEVQVWDFPSGTIGMMIMAPWYEATLREAFGDQFEDTVGVAPIPGGDDWRTLQYAFFLAVDSRSPNQEAAWDFLEWLNDARGEDPSCVGQMMFDLGALTANEPDLERGGDALADSFTAPFVEALDRSVTEPNVVQAAEIERILQGYIQQAWAGELSAEEALTRADREISEILAEFY